LHEVEQDTAVEVVHYRTGLPSSYALLLDRWFCRGGDLITVEHDIAVKTCQVMELEMCPEPFCAYDYQVSKTLCWSQVKGATGLGLARIRLSAQAAIKARPRVPIVPWHDLASALGQRLPPVHLHYPIADHRHRYS
jgi:hypothetical protein